MSRLTQVAYATALTVLINIAPSMSMADTVKHSLSIQYSDLSLDRPADVKKLYDRITQAASQVCGPSEVTGTHLPLPSYGHCLDLAVGQAVNAVASPTLSAYYQAKSGHASQIPPVAQR